MSNIINAKEIGYMSYNKLNMFMSALLIGFSISFATFGDRINLDETHLVYALIVFALIVFAVIVIVSICKYIPDLLVTLLKFIISFIVDNRIMAFILSLLLVGASWFVAGVIGIVTFASLLFIAVIFYNFTPDSNINIQSTVSKLSINARVLWNVAKIFLVITIITALIAFILTT